MKVTVKWMNLHTESRENAVDNRSESVKCRIAHGGCTINIAIVALDLFASPSHIQSAAFRAIG